MGVISRLFNYGRMEIDSHRNKIQWQMLWSSRVGLRFSFSFLFSLLTFFSFKFQVDMLGWHCFMARIVTIYHLFLSWMAQSSSFFMELDLPGNCKHPQLPSHVSVCLLCSLQRKEFTCLQPTHPPTLPLHFFISPEYPPVSHIPFWSLCLWS